jgi:hypothetical protein
VRFVFQLSNREQPVSIRVLDCPDAAERWIVVAVTQAIENAIRSPREALTPLPDRRHGYLMFDVLFANRVVRAHGGEVFALPAEKSGVVVAIPRGDNDRPNQ